MTHISIRIREEDLDLLKEVCENRDEQMSDFVRRAILLQLASMSYLDPARKKSLGVPEQEKFRSSIP